MENTNIKYAEDLKTKIHHRAITNESTKDIPTCDKETPTHFKTLKFHLLNISRKIKLDNSKIGALPTNDKNV
jgi:hypothetical protein